MRKFLALLLAFLMLGLLSGCDEETPPTELATRPTMAVEETEGPTETAEETVPAGETGETAALQTTVLRSGDEELQAGYILLAVNPEGPFLSEVKLNEDGADALIRWLSTEEAREELENFCVEKFGEPVFTLPGADLFKGWIPNAAEENQTIRLSVADTLADSGVLDQLLPMFEEKYGYTVTVQTTSASGTLTAAKLGIIDLVITEESGATDAFIAEGYAREVEGFEGEAVSLCGLEYLLCGPEEDPAGAADAKNLTDAMAAIAAGEYTFLSRGDGSTVHKLEQSLWPANQTFGAWYLEIDTDMGPLLVMNEFEGGYLLTDKLTWLIFSQSDGII